MSMSTACRGPRKWILQAAVMYKSRLGGKSTEPWRRHVQPERTFRVNGKTRKAEKSYVTTFRLFA
eukprot:7067639-Pyramimonas_sp.AAC.1